MKERLAKIRAELDRLRDVDREWRPYDVDGRPQTFLDWYESWLAWNLSPESLARLRAPGDR